MDIVSKLLVLKNKITDKDEHKFIGYADGGTCEFAAKEIEKLRMNEALLDNELMKVYQEIRELKTQP